jgi:hypothetical protein
MLVVPTTAGAAAFAIILLLALSGSSDSVVAAHSHSAFGANLRGNATNTTSSLPTTSSGGDARGDASDSETAATTMTTAWIDKPVLIGLVITVPALAILCVGMTYFIVRRRAQQAEALRRELDSIGRELVPTLAPEPPPAAVPKVYEPPVVIK